MNLLREMFGKHSWAEALRGFNGGDGEDRSKLVLLRNIGYRELVQDGAKVSDKRVISCWELFGRKKVGEDIYGLI